MSHSLVGRCARLSLVFSASVALEIRRHCPRCRADRPFASGGKFRVNAQKKLIDVWLIWRCTACDQTWNQPIHERRGVRSLPPAALEAFMRNDADLAAHHAGLLAARMPVEDAQGRDLSVERRVLAPVTEMTERLEVGLAIPPGSGLRLDRALALGLMLGRGEIAALAESGALVVAGGGLRALRRPALPLQHVAVDLLGCSEESAARYRDLWRSFAL